MGLRAIRDNPAVSRFFGSGYPRLVSRAWGVRGDVGRRGSRRRSGSVVLLNHVRPGVLADCLAMGVESAPSLTSRMHGCASAVAGIGPPSDAPAQLVAVPAPHEEPTYGPLEWARPHGGRLGAEAVPLQDDGTLRCPTGVRLWQSETRQDHALTQRLLCVASDEDCAPCPLRATCLGRTASGKRGRRVSAVRHQQIGSVLLMPLPGIAAEAMLWKDV